MSESPTKTHEVTSKEVNTSQGWRFNAKITVTVHNPNGRDFIKECTYRYGPIQMGLTASRGKVHASTDYWLPSSIIQEQSCPFSGGMEKFDTEYQASNEDELLEQCLDHATGDVESEIEELRNKDDDIKEKLSE